MPVRRRTLGLGLALSLLAAASACSDSVEDDGPSAGGGGEREEGAATTRGVTDDTITVGGIAYDVYFGDAAIGVEARLKQANDAGGVHGRTIELVGVEDDGNDPANSSSITQRLVEQEEVFALLPVMTGLFGGGDYIVENEIPMFGYGVNPGFCGNEVAFGITGCVTNPSLEIGSNTLGTILEDHFGDADRTIAFIAEDNDTGRGGLELLRASVEDKGFEVVMADAVLPAPPDPLGDASPFVSQILSSDGGSAPDAVYLQATLSGTALADGLQKAGYEGMIITPSYSPLLLGQPGYSGVYVNTQISMDPEVAANAEMLEAVAAVDPEAELNLALSAGYWAADLFIQALEETGPELTVEAFLDTLNDGFTYSVEGVVGESSWPANHDKPVPCAALARVEGEAFVQEIPLTCGENIEVG